MSRFILAVLVLCALTAPLAAQSSTRSADASASVIITPTLTLTKVQDLNFGSHFATEGVVQSSSTVFAQWNGTTDSQNSLSLTFTLPTFLQRVGNSQQVAIAYGTNSALYDNAGGGISIAFDPHTGLPTTGSVVGGAYSVRLGTNFGQTGQAVSIDLSGHGPGTYQGVITLTVTVL